MNKNIVICLNPFRSHFIPTIPFANQLIHSGCNLAYMGFSNMQGEVREKGFKYISIISCDNHELTVLKQQKKFKKLSEAYRKLHVEIEGNLKSLQVNFVFMGISRFPIYLLPAIQASAKVMFYSLCAGEPGFSVRYPPVTSDYTPSQNIGSKVVCLAKWFGRFLRKGVFPMRHLISTFYYPWTEIRRMSKEQGVKWKFGIDGFFPAFPMIIFGTKYLEYEQTSNIKFAGLCVQSTSNNMSMNRYHFEDEEKPLIYCCFGTMSSRYRNVKAFWKALLEVFIENKQWNLLLSMGSLGAEIDSSAVSDNIQIVDFVDQMAVLQRADLMLTHGGHGTVKECIYSGVPMIVFSCSYDQHGDAARVHFHNIGVKSPMLKKTITQRIFKRGQRKIIPEDIKVLIEKVLGNEKYKCNIRAMRDRIEHDNEMEHSIQSCFNGF